MHASKLLLTIAICLSASITTYGQDFGEVATPLNAQVLGALRPISNVTADIRPTAGALPTQTALAVGHRMPERHLGMTFCWQATNLSHGSLAFEEYNLERYGHSVGCLQPAVSGAHFLSSVALLPYTAIFENHCEYELGHFRPGSCAPFVILRDGKAIRGAAFNAAFLTIL